MDHLVRDRLSAILNSAASRRGVVCGSAGGSLAALLGWPGAAAKSNNKKTGRGPRHRDRVDAEAQGKGGAATLKVLTHNVYFGADLGPVFRVSTPEQLIAAVTQVFAMVQATNFPERARELAKEIAKFDPHLVGLQEVALWRSQQPADFSPAPNAQTVEYDFLTILLDELAKRGKAYEAVATVQNADAEAPRAAANGLQDIRFTDRNVILARTDLPTRIFAIDNAQSANFDAKLVIPNPVLGAVPVPQGWAAVDVTLKRGTVRVVNTHLERLHPGIQVAQGQELLAGPLDSALPTVLLGDLNSAAGGIGAVPGESDTPTYANLLNAEFSDAASGKPGKKSGFTCCQAEDLTNAESSLSERIDFVLTRGEITASEVKLVGEKRGDRTRSGLWPSDHAGVSAVLQVR